MGCKQQVFGNQTIIYILIFFVKSCNKNTSSSRLWKCWDSYIVSNVDSDKSIVHQTHKQLKFKV